jgi:hypothetical protein
LDLARPTKPWRWQELSALSILKIPNSASYIPQLERPTFLRKTSNFYFFNAQDVTGSAASQQPLRLRGRALLSIQKHIGIDYTQAPV